MFSRARIEDFKVRKLCSIVILFEALRIQHKKSTFASTFELGPIQSRWGFRKQ